MKNVYSVKDKLNLILLATGVFCFGLILPDSISDHTRLVHFSAHFGMSFLLALCSYLVCTIKFRFSKAQSYIFLITATLLIGVFYKYWEIASQGTFERFSFSMAIEQTGALTSMSQNLSGLFAAMLLIEGLVDRNMIMSVLKSGDLHYGPGSYQGNLSENRHPGSMQGHLRGGSTPLGGNIPLGGSMPAGSLFSPEASEN